MAKRLAVLGAVAVVMALAISMMLPAGAQDDERRTIRVASVTTEEEFVDVGAPDFSLGDEFVFSSNLFREGNRVGRTGVVCTITSVTREEAECVATARFGNGQITAQGLVRGDPEQIVLPVTGGSGAYLGAEGAAHTRQVTPRREIITFRLED
jgi:hypothetical protein